jgi:cysteinyl-tRNA synthetase
LGHARPYITFDVLFRLLQHQGNKVRYVRNITDAGHFEEEGREAEDKIASKAQLERLEPMELVQKYTRLYHWAMKEFNCLEPSIEPTATGHIVEQIEMIKQIMNDGYAYEAYGSVYFDVEKYHQDFGAKGMPYGILSGRVLEEQLETTRELENQEEKRNKADFALWKAAPPQHLMRWNSPWGEGFPGWHIECSAMSYKYLGKQFDIHGGGMDLQFPHHECEIAQSTVCHHQNPARYWVHNNMITINGRKMGKSYNNVIKLTELFSGKHPELHKAYSPMTVRFFILQSHYRSPLDFSNEALQAGEKGLKRLWDAYVSLQALQPSAGEANEQLTAQVNLLLDGFELYINDDLSTAKVLANMFELVPIINGIKDGHIPQGSLDAATLSRFKELFKIYIEDIFGLVLEQSSQHNEMEGVMQLLLELRNTAKANKDFQTSDHIRKQLEALGFIIKDGKEGSSWSVN